MIDSKVVARYREHYHLGGDIGEAEVRRHWELESSLTQRLLASTKETRWRVFQECYTELYEALPWLNRTESFNPHKLRPWSRLIPAQSKILEVGSGNAHLLQYLATLGHDCTGSEVTPERGKKHVDDGANLAWHTTDGVNIARFEACDSYDVVISTQVIEHLHPEDIETHFSNVFSILKPGGRCIFDTPHRGIGPSDVSAIFGFERPVCMHLKEYNFVELNLILKAAGFRKIHAVLYRRRPIEIGPFVGRSIYLYFSIGDRIFDLLRFSPRRERSARRLLRFALLSSNIWMVATKPAT